MTSLRLDLRRKVRFEDYLRYPSVKSWHDAKRSQKTMIYRLASFMEYRRKNGLSADPEEWLSECLNGTNITMINHSKVIEGWVNSSEMAIKDRATRIRYSRDIKGLYLYHHIRLPSINVAKNMDGEGNHRHEVEFDVTATEYLEMAMKVLTHAGISIRDRSVIMTIIQSAMDESTTAKVFNYVAFAQLAKHFGTDDFTRWDEDNTPVRIDLIRPKTDYRYYTFLGHDAIMLLKEYLVSRTSTFGRIIIYRSNNPKALPHSDPIYLNKYGQPIRAGYIGMIFTEAGKLAGVNVPPEVMPPHYKGSKIRYPFHAHQARDTLITLRQRVRVDRTVVDFFAGHKFDADEYDSPWDNPDLFKEEYVKLTKYLNLITGKESLLKAEYEKKLEEKLSERDRELAEIRAQQNAMLRALQDKGVIDLLSKGSKFDPSLLELRSEDLLRKTATKSPP